MDNKKESFVPAKENETRAMKRKRLALEAYEKIVEDNRKKAFKLFALENVNVIKCQIEEENARKKTLDYLLKTKIGVKMSQE